MQIINNISNASINKKYEIARNVLTWGVPPAVIPALRFFQDSPNERKKLWVRDFTTYSIGAAIFLVAEIATNFFLKRSNILRNENPRNFISFLAALTANQLYAGIGAVKLSKKLSEKSSSNLN